MLWPLPSTQWHLRHSVQGLSLFELTHLCWSTLGTEGWGCFTVIFKGEGNSQPPAPPAPNFRPQDEQLRLVEDQFGVALGRRTGRDNTQTGDNDEQHGEYISQDTTSSSVSRTESWMKEVPDTSVGRRDSQSSESLSIEGQDEEIGIRHQMAIRWSATWSVTQQVETGPSKGQEDSKSRYLVRIEGPWKHEGPTDEEKAACVVVANTPCH